jgi:hypothetical protein
MAAAAVRVDRQGDSQMAAFVHHLQISRELGQISDVHDQVDHSISSTWEMAVGAACSPHNAAEGRHVAHNGVSGEKRRHTRKADFSERLISRPAKNQGPAGGGPGHTGP